jgi:Family of unknown function (DUF6493)
LQTCAGGDDRQGRNTGRKVSAIDQERIAELALLLRRDTGPQPGSGEARSRAVLDFFAGTPEAERRRLAPEILHWQKIALPRASAVAAGGETASSEDFDPSLTWIAVAATATLAELKATRSWYPSVAACRAMAERRVTWLADGIDLALERTDSSWSIGALSLFVHELVLDGAIAPPSHDRYPIGIAFGYGTLAMSRPQDAAEAIPLLDRVRGDIDRVAPVIWRQFEVEGGGEISLANFEKYYAGRVKDGWAETLTALADERLLDRQQLLDASLDALDRGFGQYRAGWFSRFHEMLAPTPEERAARTRRYLDLLASPIGPTVSMATAALKQLHKAGRLEGNVVLESIAPALHAQAAVTAKGALALLQAAGSRPELRQEILPVAALALEHGNAEVQQAALALIERWPEALDERSRRAIADRLPVMSAALRPRGGALLGRQPSVSAPASDAAPEIAALEARAEKLPPQLRRLAGVDAALEGGIDVPRAQFTGMEIPRLDPARAIAPIAGFAELVDEALVAIEHADDLDRVERVLAGAVRFAAERPADEARLVAPLAKALGRYRGKGHDASDWATPRGALQIVLTALTGGKPVDVAVIESDPRAAMVLRTTAMRRAISAREQRIELSAPTHPGHWIDPLVLVERSREAAAPGAAQLLGVADQILALLRLAPDQRDAALAAAGGIGGEWGAALYYALGGEAPLGPTPSLWVAASRARAPFADDPRIAALAAGAERAPSFAFSVVSREGGWLGVALRARDGPAVEFGKDSTGGLSSRPKPVEAVDPARCFTTIALSDPATLKYLDTYHGGNMFHAGSWATALWPQHPEPVFALSAKAACMIDGNNYVRPANEPLAARLTLILDPDVPIGPMALFMLCRGLNAIDKPAAQATADALIALIEDGRLDGETLGAAVHEFLLSGLVLPKRWPPRVKDVAQSSPLGLLVMRRALERALHPGPPTAELRDRHVWIEMLHELCVEAGEGIGDPLAREAIARQEGKKAKSAAKALLELPAGRSSGTRKEAAAHALRHRIERAERWWRLLERSPSNLMSGPT